MDSTTRIDDLPENITMRVQPEQSGTGSYLCAYEHPSKSIRKFNTTQCYAIT